MSKQKTSSGWILPEHGGVVSRTSVSLDANDVAIMADCALALTKLHSGRITGTDVVRLALQRLWQSMYGESADGVFASMGGHPSHWGRCQSCGSEPALVHRYCNQCGAMVKPPAAIPVEPRDSEEDLPGR